MINRGKYDIIILIVILILLFSFSGDNELLQKKSTQVVFVLLVIYSVYNKTSYNFILIVFSNSLTGHDE